MAYSSDVYINRTQPDAPAASDTLNAGIIFINKILELMHKPLSDPLGFGASGIVSGAMHGKQRIHAAVPVAHPLAGISVGFILNVETPACGAHIRTGAAIDAGKCHILPKRGFIQHDGFKLS